MKITTEHMLDGVNVTNTPNHGGEIEPRFIVMHYTAGTSALSAVKTLTNPASRVSAHLVIDTDGQIWQLAPFNIKTWHAGPSRHMGYSGLNNHSIGIEFVNMGWLRNNAGEYERNGVVYKPEFDVEMLMQAHPRVGSGEYFWPSYPDAQIAAGEAVTKLLVERYHIIDIVSHEEIDTRGWKTDPGPAFPMHQFKHYINERKEDHDPYVVTASSLNIRSGPGMFDIIGKAQKGDIVVPTDAHGDWVRISDDGWVHGAYLRRA